MNVDTEVRVIIERKFSAAQLLKLGLNRDQQIAAKPFPGIQPGSPSFKVGCRRELLYSGLIILVGVFRMDQLTD